MMLKSKISVVGLNTANCHRNLVWKRDIQSVVNLILRKSTNWKPSCAGVIDDLLWFFGEEAYQAKRPRILSNTI